VPDLVVTLRISLARDGSLAQDPVVVNSSPHPLFQSAAQSAIRALRKCAPFNFLPVAKYENWKSIDINFVSRDLLKDK
jgi:colicin import membrane protein